MEDDDITAHEGDETSYKVVVGKHERRDLAIVERLILKCVCNEVEGDDVDWIHLIQNKVMWLDVGNMKMTS